MLHKDNSVVVPNLKCSDIMVYDAQCNGRVEVGYKLCVYAEASEGCEQTKHWRGKPLFTNNRLPLQCFVSSEPSDAPGTMVPLYPPPPPPP